MKKRLRLFLMSCALIAAFSACSSTQPELTKDSFPDTGESVHNAGSAAVSGGSAASASISSDCRGKPRAGSAGELATCDAGAAAGSGAQIGTRSGHNAGTGAAGVSAAASSTAASAGMHSSAAASADAAAGNHAASAAMRGDSAGSAAGTGGRAGSAAVSGGPQSGAAAGSGGASTAAGHGADTRAFHACPSDGSTCKIMPFGDSITDGYNQDTPGGYRIELFRRAHAAGKDITFVGSGSNGPDKVDGVAFPHNHEGHSGWTIAPAGGRSGISTLVSMVMPQYKPHIVLLMIGTNDAIDNYEMAKAPERLGQLIDSIYAQLPDVTILVAQLIPARDASNQGDDAQLNTRIQTFNEAIPALVSTRASGGKHIFVVDMFTPYSRDQRMSFEDQWHPNAAGYTLIGSTWYAALEPLL